MGQLGALRRNLAPRLHARGRARGCAGRGGALRGGRAPPPGREGWCRPQQPEAPGAPLGRRPGASPSRRAEFRLGWGCGEHSPSSAARGEKSRPAPLGGGVTPVGLAGWGGAAPLCGQAGLQPGFCRAAGRQDAEPRGVRTWGAGEGGLRGWKRGSRTADPQPVPSPRRVTEPRVSPALRRGRGRGGAVRSPRRRPYPRPPTQPAGPRPLPACPAPARVSSGLRLRCLPRISGLSL